VNDRPDLRVSDRDRERAAEEIAHLRHFAAGRLTEDELDERVQAAVHAQTQRELSAVRQDLPSLPVPPTQRKGQLAERRKELRAQLIQEAEGGVVLFGVCAAIWAASGAHGMFWPIWVALAVLLPLVRSGWRLYGPAPDVERVEQDLASFRRRRERHEARRAARRDARRRY
jgi:hypothetical protein